ncbi:MAG TPA: hypothetical protein VF426_08325 [Marmoricola sp.]
MPEDVYREVSRPYVRAHPRLLSDHVFDKLRAIGMVLAEFGELLDDPEHQVEVIAEAHESDSEVKELLLVIEWLRPLHVVIVVDDARSQERVVTVYEPYPSEWTADFRRRR